MYALTVGKNRPKLTERRLWSHPRYNSEGPGNLPARNAIMEEFAGITQAHLDRPVVDQTGLKGRFDFQLQWMPDEFTSLSGRAHRRRLPRERKCKRICSPLFRAAGTEAGVGQGAGLRFGD